jgi:hypothetical protein
MKPSMISKFPPKDKKSFKIDEGVEAEMANVSSINL